ncbi:Ras-related protein Rab-18-B [Cryptotrichosporon argae]
MQEPSAYPTNLKLLLIGNSSVGKSSLLLRFTDDDFHVEEETAATIGVDFKVKALEVDGQRFKLSIWDTAGQERFRTLTSSYYRGAQGVILVYDVSSRPTFDELVRWFREIEAYCADDVVKMVVGNKVDRALSRQVTADEGRALAERMGTLFVECSAKTNVMVEDAFRDLVLRIVATPSLWARNARPAEQRIITLTADDDAGGWLPSCSC